jgi:hypothetical protein
MCRERKDGRLNERANGSSEVAAAGKGAVVLGLEPKNPTGGLLSSAVATPRDSSVGVQKQQQ